MTKSVWPSWRYGPNGESGIFNSPEEVPEGWLRSATLFGASGEAPQPPKPQETFPMARKEITDALKGGGISYTKNASTQALYDLLTVQVKAELTAAGAEFDPAADTKTLYHQLLALFDKGDESKDA